jgi:hypothetical protein
MEEMCRKMDDDGGMTDDLYGDLSGSFPSGNQSLRFQFGALSLPLTVDLSVRLGHEAGFQ